MFDIIIGAFGLIFILAVLGFILFVLVLCIPDICDSVIDAKKAFKRMKEEIKK